MGTTLIPPDEQAPQTTKGHGTAALGPSDSSDSGSDTFGAKRHTFDVDSELDNHPLEAGEAELGSDTDRYGTGERASADGDANLRENDDIEPDQLRDELSSRNAVDDPDDPDDPDERTDKGLDEPEAP
jgi:hypothetical protein